ncbi:dTDP-4-dehydrorhamnose 3,5-epimerase [Psychroserpens burtonensis]|uniref:dTDP-4-dehydrorhamnose 3,5-epimerase n=1 Tax=Psychroserpens burtonensis TaxID=49278 RepID=A0A5C7B9B7_9FLAO|nr:dTDP-4-dehydrorhamnose 3,5-epimerase [Psychroserpens burtonensis]TXE19104.1 dTDP-4-dehydrorhamnose 3,5-epimerase [Psychroserpens burtonensis]
MTIEETCLKDCYVLKPTIFEDHRGYFFESFNADKFQKMTGLTINFVQDNESKSSKGVLRGLHFQTGDYEQSKLVRVVKGAVLDLCVDIRRGSLTFGQHFSVELNEDNKKQLFVPKGFAHGFLVLKNETIINYKCDNFYQKDSEGGILFNDKDLNIDWGISEDEIILSDKDKILPTLSEYLNEK